jgi:agmatine deiminase
VDESTILISSVSEQEAKEHPVYKEAKKRMDENYEILINSTDQDGRAFRVIKVPMAPVIIHDRRAGPEKQIITSVTSYMNFIISNSLIVLPSYVSANSGDQKLLQKEQEVGAIFKEVFPRRDILKVRADTLNYYSGGFHCISIHEPRVKK